MKILFLILAFASCASASGGYISNGLTLNRIDGLYVNLAGDVMSGPLQTSSLTIVGNAGVGGALNVTGQGVFATVDTGQGGTEVHLMNQNIASYSNVTFNTGIITDTFTVIGNAFSVGTSTLSISNGLVGIGAAPSAGTLLYVYDGLTLNGIKIQTGGVNGTYFPLIANNTGGTKGIWLRDNGQFGINDNSADAQLDIVSDKSANDFIVSVSSQNDTTGNIFAIKGSGVVGVGTATPSAQLHIQTPAGTNSQTGYSLKISSGDETSVFGIHPDGHISIYGAKTAIATCTNGAVVTNSRDTAGTVVFSGANSTCGITFGSTFDAIPVCVLTGAVADATEGAIISQISTSSMTFVPNTGAWDSGDQVNYICLGEHD